MKKKNKIKEEISELLDKNFLNVSKKNGCLTFEIEGEVTSDLAEAVSILMNKNIDINDPIWEKEVENINLYNIVPEKTLFWLSGGYKEWDNLLHYKKPWSECYIYFQEEFGFMVINSIKRSKKLKDIRDYFIKYLNLPILYDFAISKDFI